MVYPTSSAVDSGMRDRQADDEFRRFLRAPACVHGAHGECSHMLTPRAGFNPGRLRVELAVSLCPCDCHASCPVTSGKRLVAFPSPTVEVSGRDWWESCSCPGAEAGRIRLGQAGIEFPDPDELRAKWRQESQSMREASRAVRARAAGKSREEIKELYLAELRSRGLDIPPAEALDAKAAAIAGNYLPTVRLVSRFVVDTVKLVRETGPPW